jgi:flagellar basal-body rod protein FlgG
VNYGLYTAASGMLTSLYRLDVHASNLANSETAGFKPDTPMTQQRLSVREEDGLAGLPGDAMLERLGAGVLLAPNRISMAQGSLQATDNALDVAIKGEGYFVVQDGPSSADRYVRLTRDGRFSGDGEGYLVLSANGMKVLDSGDQPIRLRRGGKVEIEANGWVRVDGTRLAQIQVAQVSSPQSLRKQGDNLFTGDLDLIARRRNVPSEVLQGFIERSAVDPVRTMLDIASAERGVSSAARLIQMHDDLMNRAINTFAKVG